MLDSSEPETVGAYKGYHLIDDTPVCDQYTSPTEYKIGSTVEAEGDLHICQNGIHVCLEVLDCFRYYEPNDVNTVIGNVEAYNVQDLPEDQQDNLSTKRVCRSIEVGDLLCKEDDYNDLILAVRDRACERHGNVVFDGIAYRNNYACKLSQYCVGSVNEVCITTGRYSFVGSERAWFPVSVAVSFGRSSVVHGISAFAMGATSIAVTENPGGIAYTRSCCSLSLADSICSVAYVDHVNSRAVTKHPLSVGIATTENSLVVLTKPGSVAVTAGSVLVKAEGCIVIVLCWSRWAGMSDDIGAYSPSAASWIKGPEGTIIQMFDPDERQWMSCVLRNDDKLLYPADFKLDVRTIWERLRKEQDENHS